MEDTVRTIELNTREKDLIRTRVKKLSSWYNGQMKLKKIERDIREMNAVELNLHQLSLWLDPKKEMRRIDGMIQSIDHEMRAERNRTFNPFTII